jgi:deoxyribodipyrimidine photo-lyase
MRINERVVQLNDAKTNQKARYVLYWMQMYKRTTHNHALTFAIRKANESSLPLVVYEGLKFYYPWASDRIHTFILEGVEENVANSSGSGFDTFSICRRTTVRRNKPSLV